MMRWMFVWPLLFSSICLGATVRPNVTYTKIVKIVDIKDVNEVVISYEYSAIVWNARGAEMASLVVPYNKHVAVENMEGALLDINGVKQRSVKGKDIIDKPAYDGFSLFSDARYKSHQFNSGEYPYQVNYAYTLRLNHNMYYLSLYPRFHPSASVDSFIGVLHFSKDLEPHYRLRGSKGNVDRTESNDKIKITYTVSQLQAEKTEPFSPPFNAANESLEVFCNQCSFAGYNTTASDWLGYGELMVQLNEGRDVLPGELVSKLNDMTRNEDPAGKVKKVYEYLQNNSRYISVQVGVGGVQPIPASEVYTNGYGDCKGLSNLMKAMLSSVGVKSHYALVEAGNDPDGINNTFVYDPFDHVILCVPINGDTTWLECTNRFDPCGYLGGFTGNRKALVIEKGNSHLAATDVFDHNHNLASARLNASFGEEGDVHMDIFMRCTHESQDLLRQLQHEVDRSIIDKYWQQAFSIPSYVVHSAAIHAYKESPTADVDIQLSVNKAITKSGPRLFLTPMFAHTLEEKLLKDTARVNDLYFNKAYTEIDTFTFTIPEGYRLESGGKKVALMQDFGSFEMLAEEKNGVYQLIRKRVQYRGTFDKSKYNDFVKYHNDIYQAERSKLVWVKK